MATLKQPDFFPKYPDRERVAKSILIQLRSAGLVYANLTLEDVEIALQVALEEGNSQGYGYVLYVP